MNPFSSVNVPFISVCMATFNGEKYIHDQLNSIASQLSEGDEIVIVDDSSSDNTISEIELISRLYLQVSFRLHVNEKNIGHILSFQKAIMLSRKPLVFLSDQDDVWLPHKVSIYRTIFTLEPSCNLIQSDHVLIDESGHLLSPSYLSSVTFLPFRLPIINHLGHGPSLAFTRNCLSYILPFPSKVASHDQWIAQICSFNGRVKHLPFQCQAYRVHSGQFTSQGRRPLILMILNRFNMLASLLSRTSSFVLSKSFLGQSKDPLVL